MEQDELYLIKGNEWKIKECNVFFFEKQTFTHTQGRGKVVLVQSRTTTLFKSHDNS